MSELIEEFKREHAELMTLLNEVRDLGIGSEEGKARLMSAKERLLEHLEKEDKQLYPVLRREAEHDNGLKKEVAMFATDPEYVSRVVAEFFDRYSGGVIDEDFTVNFESLIAALTARIRNEEDALYEEYEVLLRKA